MCTVTHERDAGNLEFSIKTVSLYLGRVGKEVFFLYI